MVKAVIVQRVVPHYRVPVFARLHHELGWSVACADSGPSHGLNQVKPGDHPWLHGFDFKRDGEHEYRAQVPINAILQKTGAEALVCEFSLQMSSSWKLAIRHPSVPFAFWSQGWNHDRGFDRLIDRGAQLLRLIMLGRADAQLTYTDEGADYLRANLGKDMPVYVAQNALSLDDMPGRTIDDSPRDPLAPHIVSIGRLSPDKHVPRVIEAFLQLRQRLPAARLTVVGDGPERAAVEAAALWGGDAVVVCGAVYAEQEVARIFQNASLLVVGGSVGLSVNHALGYGVPVMIFDDPVANHHHPEHKYVIDGVTGFRVKDNSVAGLAHALQLAFVPPGPRVALGESLRRYVDRELTIDRMVDGFLQLDRFFARQLAR